MAAIKDGDFVRTCQECGHIQKSKDPATYKGTKDSWREVKCSKCKSESLDYGSVYQTTRPDDTEDESEE